MCVLGFTRAYIDLFNFIKMHAIAPVLWLQVAAHVRHQLVQAGCQVLPLKLIGHQI
jgi:hypothetical protein